MEKIFIYFHPLELGRYEFIIPFFIDSKVHNITILGESVPLIVDVYDPMDKCLNLTNVLIGKSITKRVKVVNNSKANICIVFNLFEFLPYFSRPKRVFDSRFEDEIIKPLEKYQNQSVNSSDYIFFLNFIGNR